MVAFLIPAGCWLEECSCEWTKANIRALTWGSIFSKKLQMSAKYKARGLVTGRTMTKRIVGSGYKIGVLTERYFPNTIPFVIRWCLEYHHVLIQLNSFGILLSFWRAPDFFFFFLTQFYKTYENQNTKKNIAAVRICVRGIRDRVKLLILILPFCGKFHGKLIESVLQIWDAHTQGGQL